MSSSPSPCKERVRQEVVAAGAAAVGFARAEPVSWEAASAYRRWIASRRHAGMAYMERHTRLRDDPRLLLDGAATIIVAAFNYYPSRHHPAIADYALGRDYHDELRERLSAAAGRISTQFGGDTRVCVDSAPIRERYWAVRAGVGFIGRNSQLIIPGTGSYCFLGEILWTKPVDPDAPHTGGCDGCGKCVSSCPGRAIMPDKTIDARRCLSYLTIEHRGPLPAGTELCGRLFGCDICQRVCPHNRDARPSEIFGPRPGVMAVTRESVIAMTPEEFAATFKGSPVKRAKLEGLRRNALAR